MDTPAARQMVAVGFAGGLAAAGVVVGLYRLYAVQKRLAQAHPRVGEPLASTLVRSEDDCIYLDYNGTSPIFPEVFRAMLPFTFHQWGNPSSGHAYGLKCRSALATARTQVADLLCVTPGEITFTSCGSESDNWAVRIAIEAFRQHDAGGIPHIITSAIEHVAVLSYLRCLEDRGVITLAVVGVDRYGRMDPAEVADELTPNTALVTVMHSNNEVGVLQPIRDIVDAVRDAATSGRLPKNSFAAERVLFHTDAAQSCGKVTVNAKDLGVDLMTIVGHKFGAPKGVAALYIRDRCTQGYAIEPCLHGGGQEGGRRAGTENVLLAAGLGAAAAVARTELFATSSHMRTLRLRLCDALETRIAAHLGPLASPVNVHGPASENEKLPNTLSFGVRGVRASALVKQLGPRVAMSAGSACHEGATKMSGVLAAMGVDEELGLGTMRLSVGRHTTAREVDLAAVLIGDAVVEQLRHRAAALE